jgi:adenylate kinase
VVAVVEERFGNVNEVLPGFVLDGFPRTRLQALELDRILAAHPLDIVVNLEVPTDIVVERMRARGREDDTEDSIRKRLALYDSETKPLVEFYRERSLLDTVNGLGDESEVEAAVLAAVSRRFVP